jgi:hypothetical protein
MRILVQFNIGFSLIQFSKQSAISVHEIRKDVHFKKFNVMALLTQSPMLIHLQGHRLPRLEL